MVLALLISRPVFGRVAHAPVVGATAGGTIGGGMRAGPDISYLIGSCKDACLGLGPTVGMVNPLTEEYFGGIAFGAAYMGSGWIDAAARFTEGKYSGFHVSCAMGLAAMGYGALGFNALTKRPFLELGVTLKWPFFF